GSQPEPGASGCPRTRSGRGHGCHRPRRSGRARRDLGRRPADRSGARRPGSHRRRALEMKVAIDTNRYVDFARGDAEVVDRMRRLSRIYVPFVVLAELRAGFLCGTRSERNESNLTRFLASPRVEVVQPDEQTTHQYARLFRQLRAQRTPIPTNDLWTAALAVQHGFHLYARDRHFDNVPQIPRL